LDLQHECYNELNVHEKLRIFFSLNSVYSVGFLPFFPEKLIQVIWIIVKDRALKNKNGTYNPESRRKTASTFSGNLCSFFVGNTLKWIGVVTFEA
jgi:hypothetical protein